MNLKKYLKGKKVIIVGPAGYVEKKRLAEIINIDEFDVVVRINYSVPVQGTAYGSRTDLLYNFLCEGVETLSDEKVQEIVDSDVKCIITAFYKEPELSKFVRLLANRKNHLLIDRDFHKEVKSKVDKAPNTGIMAIMHLLKFDIKSLYVIGFDFYKSAYFQGYLNEKGESVHHDNYSQIMLLNSIQDKRLVLDEELKGVISEEKRKVSVIIPYKDIGDTDRKKSFEFNYLRYKRMFPEFEVIVSESNDEQFNRAKAINDGVKKSSGEILIIIDADIFVQKTVIYESLKWIRKYGQLFAAGHLLELDKKSTHLTITRKMKIEKGNIINKRHPKAYLMVTRDNFYNAGGFDERFKGWGGEDNAFFQSLKICNGSIYRVKGDIYHLYHTQADGVKKYKGSYNQKLQREYLNARTKEDLQEIRGCNFD